MLVSSLKNEYFFLIDVLFKFWRVGNIFMFEIVLFIDWMNWKRIIILVYVF